jgi:uncharacterized protein (DUF2249 family)
MSDLITIEKNVPLPSENVSPFRQKYPWREMDVGDSFLLWSADTNRKKRTYAKDKKRHTQNAQSLISYQHRKRPERFVWRVVDDGVRVWRVS